jgi:N-acetyl-anhydromuramyl-L-alanine amidase AmpD
MRVAIAILAAVSALTGAAIDASGRYRSPRNPERKVRSSTELIVLHTTEAPARSSLNKLSDRGEAHYCVTENGTIYAIVDRDREAFHAGRSMWNGKEDVDKFSVGIECVGYHDKPMPSVQITAIRNLVNELKAMYRLSDDRVVCHSHVAYGAPNKWHRSKHRGRKRCGMLFAMSSVRKALGLNAKPAYDPDVRAKRLAVADGYLHRVLYSGVDTMKMHYVAGSVAAAEPSGNPGWISRLLGRGGPVAQPSASKSKPSATSRPATTSKPAATSRPAATSKSSASPRSIADLKRLGYVQRGVVSKGQTALKIAGAKWNAPDTYYTIRNKVFPGTAIDAAHIEKGMVIWMKPQKGK